MATFPKTVNKCPLNVMLEVRLTPITVTINIKVCCRYLGHCDRGVESHSGRGVYVL